MSPETFKEAKQFNNTILVFAIVLAVISLGMIIFVPNINGSSIPTILSAACFAAWANLRSYIVKYEKENNGTVR